MSTGLFGIVWGVVRGNAQGWASTEILASLALGTILTVAFVLWELRSPAPMLPMRFFRNRTFAAANAASLFMFFGMFGSIFLLAQFLQTVQGYGPLDAGLRILPWTVMPIFIAPIAGALSDRIGGRPLMALGLGLQAVALGWLAAVSTPTVAYSTLVPPFMIAGIGMALFFAPVANVVLSAVSPREEGQASGANNAIRELGGVFGVAVLASVFTSRGGYESGQAFVDGLVPAIWVGAVVVAVGRARRALHPAPAPAGRGRGGRRRADASGRRRGRVDRTARGILLRSSRSMPTGPTPPSSAASGSSRPRRSSGSSRRCGPGQGPASSTSGRARA